MLKICSSIHSYSQYPPTLLLPPADTFRSWIKYGVRSPKFTYLGSMCTAVLIGWDPQPPPPPCIWAFIIGRYWSAKIDHISLCSPDDQQWQDVLTFFLYEFPGFLDQKMVVKMSQLQTESRYVNTVNKTLSSFFLLEQSDALWYYY
jgi:hypothetical protein